MPKKSFTVEQIVAALREAESAVPIVEVCRRLATCLPLSGSPRQRTCSSSSKRPRRTSFSLCFDADAVLTLYLEGVPFAVLVSRQLFTNQDGSESILYLSSSDLSLSSASRMTIYQRRWKVEEYHKSRKSNTCFAKSQGPSCLTRRATISLPAAWPSSSWRCTELPLV